MIRFPKRNIAQRQEDRDNNPVKPEPALPAPVPPAPEPQPEQVPVIRGDAPWVGILYPSQLWSLHRDIDVFAYERHTLSPKDRDELDARIPKSIGQAERQADKLLYDFVQSHINQIGTEAYYKLLEQATNDKIRILLALRCLMASTTAYEESTLVIFTNTIMDSKDFYPDPSYWVTETDPITGEKIQVVQDKKAYQRSEEVQSRKHRVRMQGIMGPKASDRDKMPTQMADQMRAVLESYGIDPNVGAAALLDHHSKGASIEERILARIAYLVMNAVVRKKTHYLNG
jgi:hypothetical protein